MAGSGGSLLRGFLSLFFLLFLHIGHASCCFSPGPAARAREEDEATDADGDGKVGGGGGSSKRRKISPLIFSPAASSSAVTSVSVRGAPRRHVSSLATSLRFYIHRIFSSSGSGAKNGGTVAGSREEEEAVATTVSSPLAQSLPHQPSTSVVLSTPSSPCASSPFMSPLSVRSLSATPVPSSSPQKLLQASRQSSRSFAARGDVFPCKVCGEVLGRPQLLELHQAMKHSLSELTHLDSSLNIIRMIFLAGWKPAAASGAGAGEAPAVRRILRIHHNPRALARFEEYRDLVRARAARRCGEGAVVEERCIADGNERLRFHCSTMLCSLGGGGGVCGSPYCCVCRARVPARRRGRHRHLRLRVGRARVPARRRGARVRLPPGAPRHAGVPRRGGPRRPRTRRRQGGLRLHGPRARRRQRCRGRRRRAAGVQPQSSAPVLRHPLQQLVVPSVAQGGQPARSTSV